MLRTVGPGDTARTTFATGGRDPIGTRRARPIGPLFAADVSALRVGAHVLQRNVSGGAPDLLRPPPARARLAPRTAGLHRRSDRLALPGVGDQALSDRVARRAPTLIGV